MVHINNSIEIEIHSPEKDLKDKAEIHAIMQANQEQPDQEQQEEGSTDQEQCHTSTKQSAQPEPRGFSTKITRLGRAAVFAVIIGLLVMGRFSVPDNAVACIEDKVLEGLKAANDFINNPQNDYARRAMQALCSFCIDVMFIGTFIYWILKGNSWRLPLSLGIFYLVRIIVQKFWFMPFPSGYIWDDPGVPSLVVPYGRGSDFYFSGHTGFVTIIAKEWHKIGHKGVRNVAILIAAYTIMILMIYRIHYSIDVFTGLFFSDWCYITVDANKEWIDSLWLKVSLWTYGLMRRFVKKEPKGRAPKERTSKGVELLSS